MKTSSKGIAKLQGFEKFEEKSYLCPAKVWTIGFGTTLINDQPVKPGMYCVKAQALEWFAKDLQGFEDHIVETFPHTIFNQNQFDALVCFLYNNGSFAHANTLVKAIKQNPNDEKNIRAAFLLYVKVRADQDKIDNDGDGKIDEPGEMKTIQGLVNRRNYEIDMYFGISKK